MIKLPNKCKCYYCERTITHKSHEPQLLLTNDHVIPRFIGGQNEPSNIVKACAQCNIAKGSLLLKEFYNRLNNKIFIRIYTFHGEWYNLIPTIKKNIKRHPYYKIGYDPIPKEKHDF